MRILSKNLSPTSIKLIIAASSNELSELKAHTLSKISKNIKVPGFRTGNVPPQIAEKQFDANYLQAQVLDEALNHLYNEALLEKKVRPVSQPKVDIVKFVPYNVLEFTVEVEIIGEIILPDYTKVTAKRQKVKVSEKEVNEVLERLSLQAAEFRKVDRASKKEDRVWIDFEGFDAKGVAIDGAKGQDYPLALGSDTFIPGFEDNIVGLNAGDEKSFEITFPKDYHVATLQSEKVTFQIVVKKVEEVKKAKLDKDFAAKVGPYKSIDELKEDIREQLKIEKETTVEREFEDAIINDLIKKTKISLPQALLEEQMTIVDSEFRQNLTYRGQTMQEYLDSKKLTEQHYKEKELKPAAEERLKAGLILSEVADREGITVNATEIDQEIAMRKMQYATDRDMQEELDKPENRNNIRARLIAQKTIAKLVSFA